MQITPNLLVHDMARSVRFYTEVLGLEVEMSVDAHQKFEMGSVIDGAVFVVVKSGDAQLMLEQAGMLAEEVPGAFTPDQKVSPWGTVYFRGLSPDDIRDKLAADQIVVEPKNTWYGMYEMFLRDPDGHVLCVGTPVGNALEHG
jgi:catechol 2,3-dioxygenase-like lactoylglutathione lyase family enzyme